jgi:hypothetical protein
MDVRIPTEDSALLKMAGANGRYSAAAARDHRLRYHHTGPSIVALMLFSAAFADAAWIPAL